MKKVICIIVVLLLLFSFSSCGAGTRSDINPLADKQFEPYEFDSGDDFPAFFADLHDEYSSCLNGFADYLEKHTDELENGKSFADLDDYETSFERYYRFLYGVMYCESDSIPDEYAEVWSLFKTLILTNKVKLDGLYNLKGEEMISGMTDMLTYIETGNEMVNAAMPNEMEEIKIGDTIALDFVEMTIDSTGVSDTILPVDTSRVYSYISDIENEQYFYVKGTIKNLSGESYDVEDLFAQFVFDDKYTYNAILAACANSNDFYDEYVKPLGTVVYYIHASIPDELIQTYTHCSIVFGFQNEFGGTRYISEDDCDYLFRMNVER